MWSSKLSGFVSSASDPAATESDAATSKASDSRTPPRHVPAGPSRISSQPAGNRRPSAGGMFRVTPGVSQIRRPSGPFPTRSSEIIVVASEEEEDDTLHHSANGRLKRRTAPISPSSSLRDAKRTAPPPSNNQPGKRKQERCGTSRSGQTSLSSFLPKTSQSTTASSFTHSGNGTADEPIEINSQSSTSSCGSIVALPDLNGRSSSTARKLNRTSTTSLESIRKITEASEKYLREATGSRVSDTFLYNKKKAPPLRSSAFGSHGRKKSATPIGRTPSSQEVDASSMRTPIGRDKSLSPFKSQDLIPPLSSTPNRAGPSKIPASSAKPILSPNQLIDPLSAESNDPQRRWSITSETTPKASSSAKAFANGHKRTHSEAKRARKADDDGDTAFRPKSRNARTSTGGSTSSAAVSDRPKRSRLSEGAYTVPQMTATDWPSKKGTFAGASGKRRNDSFNSAKQHQVQPNTETVKDEVMEVEKARRREISSSLSSVPASRSPSKSPIKHLHASDHLSPEKLEMVEEERQSDRLESLTPPSMSDKPDTKGDVAMPETKEPTEEPEDLLAEFDDFPFAPDSPTNSLHSMNKVHVPHSPRSTRHISKSPLTERFHTPRSHFSTASPTKMVTFRARTPTASPLKSKSLTVNHVPSPIKISPRYVKMDLDRTHTYAKAGLSSHGLPPSRDEMIAAAEQRRISDRQKAEQESKVRQRRMAKLLDDGSGQSEEEEEGIEDLDDVLGVGSHLNPPKSANSDTKPDSLSSRNSLRHSERIRTASMGSEHKATSNHQPTRPIARKKPSEFDLLIKQQVKLQQSGISGTHADIILAQLEEDKKQSAKNPYPTPVSPDGADSDDEDLDDEEFKKVLDNMPTGVMDKESARASRRQIGEGTTVEDDDWDGFWLDQHTSNNSKSGLPRLALPGEGPVSQIICDLANNQDLDSLALLLSTGALAPCISIAENSRALVLWLINICIGNPAHFASAQSIFNQVLPRYAEQQISQEPMMLEMPLVILRSIGARPEYLPKSNSKTQLSVNINQDDACQIALILVSNLIFQDPDYSDLGYDWTITLLLLAADRSTPDALRVMIQDAVQAHLTAVLNDVFEYEVAGHLYSRLLRLPPAARLRFMDTLPSSGGTVSHFTRNLHRWMACQLLLSAPANDSRLTQPMPAIEMLVEAAEVIRAALSVEEPDHKHVGNLVALFSAAMGPVSEYLAWSFLQSPAFSAVPIQQRAELIFEAMSKLRTLIVVCMRKIRPRLSKESGESQNQARLSQIHVNLGVHLEIAKKKWRRETIAQMRGVKDGDENAVIKGGQLKLDLGKPSTTTTA